MPVRLACCLFLTPCLTLATLGGCAGNDAPAKAKSASLAGPVWLLESFGAPGDPLPEGVSITFQISDEGAVSGSAGCNRYHGTVTVSGDELQFGPLASTKKACMEPEGLMDLERRYLESLGAVTGFRIDGPELTLHSPDGPILQFRQDTP